MKVRGKRGAALALCLLLGVLLCVPASAREAYRSYTYDWEGRAVYAPAAAVYAGSIDAQTLGTPLQSIDDVVYGPDGRLYIVDGKQAAVHVCTPEGQRLRTIDGFDWQGARQSFASPSGLFVTAEGELYVADTGNNRVVHLDGEGRALRLITEPASPLLGADFGFQPIQVAVDSVGQMYVVSADFTNGLIVLDQQGEFLQCMGAPRVSVDWADYVWRLISTEEQLAQMTALVPTEYNNVAIDDEDFVYVTCNTYSTWDYIGGKVTPLKKLNARGNDVLPPSPEGRMPYGDVDIVPNGAFPGGSSLVDTAPMGNGLFAVLDANRCKVFVYTSDSQLLFTFGGPGSVQGTLKEPAALAFGDQRFYVADAAGARISLFTLTGYGDNLLLASRLYDQGDYDGEEAVWRSILGQNANNTITLSGIARSAYENGDYALAMERYRDIGDVAGYSRAFVLRRRELINRYAWLAVPALALAAAALVLRRVLKRRRAPAGPGHPLADQVLFARRVIFRPLSASWDLTREGKGSLPAGLVLLGAATLVMFVQTYATGYIFTGGQEAGIPAWIALLKVALTVLVFSVCNWCVSSLLDGKGTFRQIVITYCYALTPLILLIPPAVVLSHLLAGEEGGLYTMLLGLAYGWTLILIICGNRQVHDYSMGKSLFVLLLTVLVMAILVFLFVLFLILIQQMVLFGADIVRDIRSFGG